jgi:hypothetical protein
MQKKNEKGIVSAMIITETKVRKNAQIPGFSPTVAVDSNMVEQSKNTEKKQILIDYN